ncbi:ABC transporter ATP-binding protein [Ramlibacter sp. AN1133]|uniref:ABC transporter ATP-binding protein n=1 Tax=Ramlibacter sp. AN1133 TaxID=3133429 RepID=UPI0030C1BE94
MQPMLEVDAIHASYGAARVLFGISLAVYPGEAVALAGRNGMGKTTTLRSVLGILRPSAGAIRFGGRAIDRMAPNEVVQTGIGYVPEGRQIFRGLTVRENLQVAAIRRKTNAAPVWDLDAVLELFPVLRQRLRHDGQALSGGEQQMLAIGRALMTNPALLILDEATEGLAPLVRGEIWRVLGRLKSLGQSLLLVDKHLASAAGVADRHYVIEKGRDAWQGTSAELAADVDLQRRLLGV